MNKKLKVSVIIILIIIVLSFVIGLMYTNDNMFCTMMGCPCEGINGERPCNGCSTFDPIFTTFIIDFGKECSAKEIIICVDGQVSETRYDIDKSTCRYKFAFLSGIFGNY